MPLQERGVEPAASGVPVAVSSETCQTDSMDSLQRQQQPVEAVLLGLGGVQRPEGLAEHTQLHGASERPAQRQGSAVPQTGSLQRRQFEAHTQPAKHFSMAQDAQRHQSEAQAQSSQHADALGHVQQAQPEVQPGLSLHADVTRPAQHDQDDAQVSRSEDIAVVVDNPQTWQQVAVAQPPHEVSAAASASGTAGYRASPTLQAQLAQHGATAAGDAERHKLTRRQPTDLKDSRPPASKQYHAALSAPDKCTHGSAAATAASASVAEQRQDNATRQQPSEQQRPVQSGREEPTLDVFAKLLHVSANIHYTCFTVACL